MENTALQAHLADDISACAFKSFEYAVNSHQLQLITTHTPKSLSEPFIEFSPALEADFAKRNHVYFNKVLRIKIYLILIFCGLVKQASIAQTVPVSLDTSDTSTSKQEEVEFINDRISIGTNFDLVNRVALKDIYTSVDILKPNIVTIKGKQFGFSSGIYTNRSLSSDSTRGIRSQIISPKDGTDSLTRTIKTYRVKAETEISNIGLYFSPLINLWSPSSANQKTNLFLSLDLEVIQRRFVTKREIELRDSSSVTYFSVSDRPTPINNRPAHMALVSPESISRRTDSYFGIGPLVHVVDRNIDLTLKGSIGYLDYLGKGYFYYLAKFNVISLSGKLNLGGEIRGIRNQEPFISIHLSKSLGINELAKIVAD